MPDATCHSLLQTTSTLGASFPQLLEEATTCHSHMLLPKTQAGPGNIPSNVVVWRSHLHGSWLPPPSMDSGSQNLVFLPRLPAYFLPTTPKVTVGPRRSRTVLSLGPSAMSCLPGRWPIPTTMVPFPLRPRSAAGIQQVSTKCLLNEGMRVSRRPAPNQGSTWWKQANQRTRPQQPWSPGWPSAVWEAEAGERWDGRLSAHRDMVEQALTLGVWTVCVQM